MKEKLLMQVSPRVLRPWQATEDPLARLRLCKKHPGIANVKVLRLPAALLSSISSTVQNFDFSRLVAKVPWLEERFHSATLPAEGGEIERTKRSLESTAEFRKLQELDALERGERRASEESDLSNMSEAERTRVKLQTQKKLRNMLSARLKQRSSISYNDGAELDLPIVYLLTRMAPNYAAIYRVLSELKQRADPNWRPISVLDYSSRCGTTCWVTDELWPNSISQHLLCDTSARMHELASLLFKNGNENADRMRFRGVTCRTFLPLQFESNLDLVVSAYSLVELPNLRTRMQTVATLWQATAPGGYLVLMERGTRAGFQAIAEVRAFLINLFANLREQDVESESESESKSASERPAKGMSGKRAQFGKLARHFKDVFAGELVAPCPHSGACPRFSRVHGGGRLPCSFPVQYYSLQLAVGRQESVQTEQFSYAVFRKAENEQQHKKLLRQAAQIGAKVNLATSCESESDDKSTQWPRVLQPALLRHHHTHLKVCCPDGDIRHVMVSRGNSHPSLYKCSRYCDAGDQLPATFCKLTESSDGDSRKNKTNNSQGENVGDAEPCQ